MKALFDALVTKFTATPHNDIYTDMGGKIYLDQAIQSATFPYLVYGLVADNPEYLMALEENGIFLIQFSLFSTDQSATNIESYYTHLKSLYDNCTLSVTGYKFIDMKRIASRIFKDDRPAWCRSVDYRIFLEKS